MELGKHLVRELDFEDGVDTLGRWMAHHLAELIHEAENSNAEEKRIKASQQAVDTILKIWEHRKNLPREAFPLAKYEDLLKVIERLRIRNDPFRFEIYNFQSRNDQLASMLFDNFTRLVISLLLMKVDSLESKKLIDTTAIESLGKDEKKIWSAIQEWGTIFDNFNEDESPKSSGKKRKPENVDLKKNSIMLIKSVKYILDELHKELHK